MKAINANRFSVTPSLLVMMLTQSGLQWAIPDAQHVALQNLAFTTPTEILREVVDGKDQFFTTPTIGTLCGIPSIIDNSLPPDVMELRLRGEVLARVELLATPHGMEA
jgi:hypothetical protein